MCLESKAVVVFEAEDFFQQICKAHPALGMGITVKDLDHVEVSLVRVIHSKHENKSVT